MRSLLIFFVLITNFISPVNSFSQKRKVSLYGDIDINNLSPTKPIDSLQQLDSFQKYLGFAYDKNGTLDKLFLFENNFKGNRVGNILHKKYGTVIGFNVLKSYGYEKVLFGGDRDYDYDSILLKGDTVIGTHYNDNYFGATLCWSTGDTITVKTLYKNYRYSRYNSSTYPIKLRQYKQYFTTTFYDKTTLYRIIKTGNDYKVEWLEPDAKKLSDYDRNSVNNRLLRYGNSMFWLVVDEGMFVE